MLFTLLPDISKYTLPNIKKPMPLIPKPHVWICICPVSNNVVSTTIYHKRDDFYFEMINFLSIDGDVPRPT